MVNNLYYFTDNELKSKNITDLMKNNIDFSKKIYFKIYRHYVTRVDPDQKKEYLMLKKKQLQS